MLTPFALLFDGASEGCIAGTKIVAIRNDFTLCCDTIVVSFVKSPNFSERCDVFI